MNKLLKDAIADAKAVRETALAQAKLALEEAFAPKLQSMLSTKIREEMDDAGSEEPNMDDESMRMKELAGLYEKGDEGDDMGGEEDFSSEEDDMGGEEDFSSDDDMGGEEDFGDEEFSDDDMGGEEESSDDEDLEEILRQLEEDSLNEEPDPDEDPEAWMRWYNSLEEADSGDLEGLVAQLKKPGQFDKFKKAFGLAEGGPTDDMEGDYKPDGDGEEEINLEELIQALREGDDEEEKEEMNEADDEYTKAGDQAMDTSKGSHGNVVAERKKMKKMSEELNEAYSAVKYLREKLSEVNLLNAKLLYVNKLFRKSGLSESQKVKIIETFDRAKNVREAKLIYATLTESMSTSKTRKPVVENFASAPVKKTQVITEGSKQMNRFKTLAGIIKS